MTSTLCFRKTPSEPPELGHCKVPLKSIFARKYYDHDGSCGGGIMTLGAGDLEWLMGVQAAMDAPKFDKSDIKLVDRIIKLIEDGETVDMWFEV